MKKIISNVLMRTIVLFLVIFTALPFNAHAFGRLADGGNLRGLDTICTCSAGETIKVGSVIDNSQHVYLYQPGATTLYANYNLFQSGPTAWYLTTLTPVAICLVYHGEECDTAGGQTPEGIFRQVGTSFNQDGNTVLSFLKEFPGVDDVTKAIQQANLSFSLKQPDRRL